MTTAPSRVTIEVGQQKTLLLGTANSLLKSISNILSGQDMDIVHLRLSPDHAKLTPNSITPAMLLRELQTGIPDYIIINADAELQSWLSVKENLLLFKKAVTSWKTAKTMKIVWEDVEIKLDTDRTCHLSEIIGVKGHSSTVSDFINQATMGKIEIEGDGLDTINPITYEDAASACIEFLLSPYITSPVTLVENPESISLLNLAHKIRASLEYKVGLAFVEESEEKTTSSSATPIHEITGWQPKLSMDDTIALAVKKAPKHKPRPSSKPEELIENPKTTTSQRKTSHLKPLKKTLKKTQKLEFMPIKLTKQPKKLRTLGWLKNLTIRKKPRPKKLHRKWSISLLLLSAYLLSILLAVTIMAYSTKVLISRIKEGAPSTLPARTLSVSASYLQSNLTIFQKFPLLDNSQTLQDINLITGALITIADAGEVATETSLIAQNIFAHILGDKPSDIAQNIQSLSRNASSLYETLSLIEGQLPRNAPSIIPHRWHDQYDALKSQLGYTRRAALAAKNITTALHEVLGVGESRKYALLLQNNMELRPTGGFIGSFAIADLENGQLFDLQVYDVYQADGQLKGHVEPPDPIRIHLGEINWYLRDSNWDPHFPTSARRAEWFIEKTIGQQIDGVIGVNVYTIKNILEAVGPINIPDYDEEITPNNLFERAEYHSEINFFPGSTQKKEFLASLTSALLLQIQEPEQGEAILLARSLYDSLIENQLTFSTQNPQSEAILEQLGWNGAIKDPPCPKLGPSQECLNDYVFIVDANLGINKANFFVSREIESDVTISKDFSVKNKLTITYTNTSVSNAWPAGQYKNYQRVYLPPSISVKAITIDGVKLSSEDITLEEERGKTVVGYIVEVPLSSTTIVQLEYSLPDKIDQQQPMYSLYWQKQPGTADDPLTIRVHHPLFLEPQVISPVADVATQIVTFDIFNTQDRRIVVGF